MASTYTWSLLSGTLPPGLTLNTTETDLDTLVSGTATTPGVYNFTVRITNDISGAFDDQAYTLTISDVFIEITPDLGRPIGEMFDVSNPKLVSVGKYQMTDVSGQEYNTQFIPARLLRFRADLDGSIKTWQLPAETGRNITAIGRKHLWRTTAAPTVINEVTIV